MDETAGNSQRLTCRSALILPQVPPATSLITLAQSPGAGWRNSRAVGYQGLSVRSITSANIDRTD